MAANTSRRITVAVASIGLAAAVALPAAGAAVAESRSVPEQGVLTGLPDRTVAGFEDAGAVELRTKDGTKRLLTAPDPQPGAHFGSAIHEGEISWLDTPSYTFVGAPGLTVDGKPNAGGVYVYERDRGQVEYLTLLTQDHPRIPGDAQAGARFGTSVDSSDVEDDDAADDFRKYVVIGVPGLAVDGARAAGGVVQLDTDNFTSTFEIEDGELHTLASSDAGVEPTEGDRLGVTVQATWTDFVAGAPTATVAGQPNAGFVLHHRGADERADELLHPGTNGLPGQPQRAERFGAALDLAAMNSPLRLAIGAPGKAVNGRAGAGKIYTLSKARDTWRFDRGFSQDSPDNGAGQPVGGAAEAGDAFGSAVQYATEDARSGTPALLVGVPGEDVDGDRDAGLVNGLYGAPGVHEGMVVGAPGTGHRFGAALSTNANGSEVREYLIGVPGVNDGAGGVAYGVRTDHAVEWESVWTLLDGSGQPGDGYGSALDQGGR